MKVIDDILNANQRHAATFRSKARTAIPARGLIVLTCMDARIDPARALGLKNGDAHVLRNAGARLTDDMLRSIIVSIHMMKTDTIVVMQHTDCGMRAVTNDDIRATVRERLGVDATAIDFLPVGPLDDSVQTEVAALRASPYVPRDIVLAGLVYDVATGRVRRVA